MKFSQRETCKCGAEVLVTFSAWLVREVDLDPLLTAFRGLHAGCYGKRFVADPEARSPGGEDG